MADNKKIKTALISVFHKDGLEELLKKLNDEGVKFLAAARISEMPPMSIFSMISSSEAPLATVCSKG